MTIKREDLDRRIVDFADVTTGRRLPPVHPGEILRDEFLTPLGMSAYELANAIKAPCSRVSDIVLGRRAITTDTAMRLARYFGTSPEFWINLQARYDLEHGDDDHHHDLNRNPVVRFADGSGWERFIAPPPRGDTEPDNSCAT